MRKLLLATNNLGKVAEFRELLADCGWQLVTPADIGLSLDVAEDGLSYADNARIKAEAFARASGLPSLADDSGLEVDALNGEPGPLHHLHGWDGNTNAERIEIILRALKDVPAPQRTARFRSVIVVALPGGATLETEGTCDGVVSDAPHGEGGFGYDPVFYIPSLGRTVSELTTTEKNAISHRGLAAEKMRKLLRGLA
jgi:XTP/dITP diphosphohydrolase